MKHNERREDDCIMIHGREELNRNATDKSNYKSALLQVDGNLQDNLNPLLTTQEVQGVQTEHKQTRKRQNLMHTELTGHR